MFLEILQNHKKAPAPESFFFFFLQARGNEKNSRGYQLCNIVGHHGWPTKKTFHFKLLEGGNVTFHQ